jgi:Pectate lyase superfamily protein
VRKQQSFIFQTPVALTAHIALFWLLASTPFRGQTDASFDRGGAVFNVKAYGAIGNGSSDDTASIQHAIDAALAAGGGIVYLPAGTFLLKGTLTNKRVDVISLVGSGMGTNVVVSGDLGISLDPTAGFLGGPHGYHSGRIEGMHISCSNPSRGTAVRMTDMVIAPQLIDLTVSRCNQAFDVINQKAWNERLVASNVADDNNNHLFHLDQDPKDQWNSYGYAIYDGIFVNKAPGQDVFYLTGGAYLYGSKIVIKGNFDLKATGASIFNVQGGPGEPCPAGAYNAVDIAVEGGSYSIVRTANNGCKGGFLGNAVFRGTGPVNALGNPVAGASDSITDSTIGAVHSGDFTATNAKSDSVAARAVTPGSACYVQPTNAIAAAAMNGTYVSADWGRVNVAHPPAAAGGKFQVWCTAQ